MSTISKIRELATIEGGLEISKGFLTEGLSTAKWQFTIDYSPFTPRVTVLRRSARKKKPLVFEISDAGAKLLDFGAHKNEADEVLTRLRNWLDDNK